MCMRSVFFFFSGYTKNRWQYLQLTCTTRTRELICFLFFTNFDRISRIRIVSGSFGRRRCNIHFRHTNTRGSDESYPDLRLINVLTTRTCTDRRGAQQRFVRAGLKSRSEQSISPSGETRAINSARGAQKWLRAVKVEWACFRSRNGRKRHRKLLLL